MGSYNNLFHLLGTALPPDYNWQGDRSHSKKESMDTLNTVQGTCDFIYSLHSTERRCLLKELHRFKSIAITQELEALPPTPG